MCEGEDVGCFLGGVGREGLRVECGEGGARHGGDGERLEDRW